MAVRASRTGSVDVAEAPPDATIEQEPAAFPVPAGVSIARFVGFDREGRFQVELPSGSAPVCALSTVGLDAADAGASVVIGYEQESPGRLVIIGRVQERAAPRRDAVVRVDGAHVVVRAEDELELRCGDASIVLTKAGKVLVKGNYVLTRSRGANRIKGAYVDIN